MYTPLGTITCFIYCYHNLTTNPLLYGTLIDQFIEHETGMLWAASSSPTLNIDRHESPIYLVVKLVPGIWKRELFCCLQ